MKLLTKPMKLQRLLGTLVAHSFKHNRNKFFIIAFVNSLAILLFIFHEDILNVIDSINMPTNEDLCKSIPMKLSNRSTFVSFVVALYYFDCCIHVHF